MPKTERSLEYWNSFVKRRSKKEIAEYLDELHARYMDAEYSSDRAHDRVDELEEVIERECAKFNFPDEDRPELYEVLKKKWT